MTGRGRHLAGDFAGAPDPSGRPRAPRGGTNVLAGRRAPPHAIVARIYCLALRRSRAARERLDAPVFHRRTCIPPKSIARTVRDGG